MVLIVHGGRDEVSVTVAVLVPPFTRLMAFVTSLAACRFQIPTSESLIMSLAQSSALLGLYGAIWVSALVSEATR